MSLSAKEEQRSIDKAAEEHLAAVQVLRYRRNCLASISRLPPEILSRIFSLVKFSLRMHSYYTSLAWIKVAHVSAHWRSVAMNSPMLWDDPPPENIEWVVEMLKRSRTVGLTTSTDLSSFVFRKVAGLREILRHHGTRIQHLTLTNMTLESRAVLEDLPISAPRLETLRLSSMPGRTMSWAAICIPTTALNNAENLRQLEISGCSVHWHYFSLANITHLKLHDIAYTARPTSTQFIDALAKMSKLESLDLKSILDPTVKFMADTSSGQTYFSRLQSLIVESSTMEIEMLFKCVAFPPSAVVHVRATPASRSISELSAVISSIARLYSGYEFLTLALRNMGRNDANFVRFQLFSKVFKRPNDIYVNTRARALTLDFRTSGEQVTVDEIVPNFFKNGLPLNKISHAELAINITDSDTLADTLGNLPLLSYVRIEPQSGVPFVNALYHHSNTVDGEWFPLYFRNLVSICLNVMFKTKRKYAERHAYDVDLEMLQDCLIQRYECGAEIQKLTLDDCYRLDDWGVWELENIVVDVEWDEIEQGFEREEETEEETEEESEDYDLLPTAGY